MTSDELLAALERLTGKTPNAEQRAVMEYDGGPLWVIAGPGTGKTFALILRCLLLLCVYRIPPEAIVLTTFTRKAAEELKERLLETLLLLGSEYPDLKTIDVSHMRLGTLHSLCWDLLSETPGSPYRHVRMLSPLDQAFFVLTQSRFCSYNQEPETEELFLELVRWVGKPEMRALPSRWQRARMFNTMYERLLNDLVDRQQFAQSSPAFALLVELVEEYEAALKQYHYSDYTQLQRQALELLCAPEGQTLVKQIHAAIVDEYQDSNPLQAALYRAMAAASPHRLSVVGDDDQALFRFRGGTVGCMVRFAEECQQAWPGCHVQQVALVKTYRSHTAIVDWINSYITAHPQMSLPNARVLGKAPLAAHRGSPTPPPVIWAIRGKTIKESAEHFAEVIQAMKSEGVLSSYAQCALLARSVKSKRGNSARTYIEALQAKGIAVSLAPSLKDQLVYRQILGTLLLALDRSGNYIPATFAQNNSQLAQYVDDCREIARMDPVLSRMARQIHTWLVTNKDAPGLTSLTTLAQQILNAQPCIETVQDDPVAESAARTLIQTLDSFDRVVNHGPKIPLDKSTTGEPSIAGWWVGRIYRILLEGIQQEHLERGNDAPSLPAPVDALCALTIHSAKGLEFPVTAVVVDKSGAVEADATHRLEHDVFPFREDQLPMPSAPPDVLLGGTAEERAFQDLVRLHYVAYSRAQEALLLLVVDDHLKPSALPIGLGNDIAHFQQQIEVWPPREKRSKAAKRSAQEERKGAQQHDLWGE